MSTTQAATKLGYSDDTIRRQAEAGKIPAVRVGRTWRVSAEWVERAMLKLKPQGAMAARRSTADDSAALAALAAR